MAAKKQTKKKKSSRRKISPRRLRLLIVRSIIGLIIAGVIGYLGYLFFNPLQLKSTNITIPYKTSFNTMNNIRFVFLGSKKDVRVTGDLNTDKIGEYSITYKYKDQSVKCKVTVADVTAPTLLLKNYTADLKQEITPKMVVQSVEDDTSVTVEFEENTDITGAGTHVVTVVAKDAHGNVTKAKTKITRVEDKTEPKISGLSDSYQLWQGTTAVGDSNVVISDNLDPHPKLTVDTSQVNMSVPGEYKVTYTGTDRSGNKTTATQTVEVMENPEFNKKVVYLTFEGGPSQHTAEILNILEANDAKATFFASGFNPDYNMWLEEAYKLGNTVALGSYEYDEDVIYQNEDSFWEDLAKTEAMVEEITGEKVKLFRFLGGSTNSNVLALNPDLMTSLIEEANSKGYQYFDWSVDSMDDIGNNIAASKLVDNSINQDAQYITIRLHDSHGKQTTVDALQSIIDYYKGQGYEFLPISEHTMAVHFADAE